MALGRMTRSIDIKEPTITVDSEGFQTTTFSLKSTTYAEREGRHGSTTWRNLASFSEATDLFRIRKQTYTVTTKMVVVDGTDTFQILSVEDVKGRGMYVEILAKVVEASGS